MENLNEKRAAHILKSYGVDFDKGEQVLSIEQRTLIYANNVVNNLNNYFFKGLINEDQYDLAIKDLDLLVDKITKGGEGSKGGKVIGHTKSGKPIYENALNNNHKDFTSSDHNDAMKLHKKLEDENTDLNHSRLPAKQNKHKEKQHHLEQYQKHFKMQYHIGNNAKSEDAYNAVKNDDVNKSELFERIGEKGNYQYISKAKGEGSRGGKIIGHTKTGKPIYQTVGGVDRNKDFTKEDHLDAADVHRKKMSEAQDKYDATSYHYHMSHRDTHKELARREKIEHIQEDKKLLKSNFDESLDILKDGKN